MIYKRLDSRSNRQALTLIEVVTSVALLSTLLVGMLVAYSKHIRQINRASDLRAAVELSDNLLADWFSESNPFSQNRSGVFESEPNFYWRLVPGKVGAERQIGARVVSLQVFKSSNSDLRPVLSVDLLETVPETDHERRDGQ